jgi:acetoacetate decarboxylase
LFALRSAGSDRPGPYAAAFVDYQVGGVLAYHELLVACPVRAGRHVAVRITDIWVDSAASLAGGRSLWAIPKQHADLVLDGGSRVSATATAPDPAERQDRSGPARRAPFVRATFVSRRTLARVPFRASTSQLRGDRAVLTPFSGSGRVARCRAAWEFEPEGPLGYLAGRRPLASFHLRDTRLRFG